MNKIIKNALKDLDIPTYFIYNKNSGDKYITFNYSEKTFASSNNKEELIKYNVIINLYCLENFLSIRATIEKKMLENGFIKTSIPSPYYDDRIDRFCQPFQFEYLKEKEEMI